MKLNTPKLKGLIQAENAPIYKLAKNMGISQHTLERMVKGRTNVGPKVLSKVAKYFMLNISDLVIAEKSSDRNPAFTRHDPINYVYLDRIKSFSDLYKNLDYNDSRTFSDSINLLSHKIYNCVLNNDEEINRVKKFLLSFTDTAAVTLGTSKTNNSDDVFKEVAYLRKQLLLDEPIKKLEDINIGVYYGHYFYRAMNISSWLDADDIEDSVTNEAAHYRYIRPTGKRIEVLYFYQKKEYPGLPERIKISPEKGYTEEELIEEYFASLDYVHGKISGVMKENLEKYINFHKKRQWLLVRDTPEQSEYVNNPEYGFLHPNYFIHTQTNRLSHRVGLLGDTKKQERIDAYVTQKEKRFKEVCEKFRFKCSSNQSIPRYEGPVEEESIIYERLDNSEQLVVEKEDD